MYLWVPMAGPGTFIASHVDRERRPRALKGEDSQVDNAALKGRSSTGAALPLARSSLMSKREDGSIQGQTGKVKGDPEGWGVENWRETQVTGGLARLTG